MIPTIDWRGFLARPLLSSPQQEALAQLCRLPVLITGAGGSIASALASRLAAAGASLVLLESSESNLFGLQRKLGKAGNAQSAFFVLGNVSNPCLLDDIFSTHAPRLVFHAAAFKQVPLLEEQPLAAIANNVFGTAVLAEAGAANNARIVLLSSDKAVAPASVMGVTKRIAEQIVLADGGTVMRLCNVLGSRDSVAEVFAQQIADGGPLTVTDPAARRYFVTIGEAVDLLLIAAMESHPALLTPDLPAPHFIADLARFMIRELAPAVDIPIEFTRLRPGDKESEQLWSSKEMATPAVSPDLCSIDSKPMDSLTLGSLLETLRSAADARDIQAVIDCLTKLVPDYTPSLAVRALEASVDLKVRHE